MSVISSIDNRILMVCIIGFFIGIGAFISGLSALRFKRLIENLPTSKIEAIAVGLTEVCGKAEPGSSKLSSPFSKTDCLYYNYSIEEYHITRHGGEWKTVKSGDARILFYVKDDTGRLLIDPEEAQIDIPLNYEYRSDIETDPPNAVIEFLEANEISPKGLFDWKKTMRFREYFISPGDILYAMGTAKINPDHSIDNTKGSDNLIMDKGTYAKTFYISNQPEEKILIELDGKVLFGLYGGPCISLLCLAYILSYFNML